MSVDSISRATLSERAVGQFPLSIATSMAIESLIGKLPEAPVENPAIRKTELLMVNVRTLIRNLYGSIDKDRRHTLDEFTVAEAISNEIRTIETIVSEESDGQCRCLFYTCTYADILRKFTRAIPKAANSVIQQQAAHSEKTVLAYLLDEYKDTTPIEEYTRDFPDMNAACVILTHYPIDLLQRYKFTSLLLLESYTGAIKPPMMWNTKLSNGRELELVPFDRMTLQLFGDNVLFVPMSVKIRQRVYKVAVSSGWTPASTKDLVIHSIEQHRDPALEVLVKDLYRK